MYIIIIDTVIWGRLRNVQYHLILKEVKLLIKASVLEITHIFFFFTWRVVSYKSAHY